MLNAVVAWFLRKRMNTIRQWMAHPHDTQERVLTQLLTQASGTGFGATHEFSSITHADTFRERVPVSDYDQLKPYIDRMMQGEHQLLWHEPVRWFSKSSGTTADKSKFIPMSTQSIEDCHFHGAIDLLSAYCEAHEQTRLFSGKGLIIGGSHQINSLNELQRYGDLSAVLMQNMGFFAQWYRTPELNIALMDDWEKKIEALSRSTLKEDVTNISGVPTWTIILIRRLFELSGKKNLQEIWPGLELYVHGGVNFEPYREQFRTLIPGDRMRYYQTYNASEGFFAFQLEPDAHDMVLHLDNGIFYEFMPMSEVGQPHPKTLLLQEVKTGVNYALVITTNAGLWRYVVGDTIRFTSVNPYKIVVSGRIKHFINAFGEEVIVENADAAIQQACLACGASVHDYTVAPVYLTAGSKGRHEWLIEFEQAPEDQERFTLALDQSLRAVNTDYDAKRSFDIALSLPSVVALPDGTFSRWLKQKGKLGGQHKVPRLSNHREVVDEILSLLRQPV